MSRIPARHDQDASGPLCGRCSALYQSHTRASASAPLSALNSTACNPFCYLAFFSVLSSLQNGQRGCHTLRIRNRICSTVLHTCYGHQGTARMGQTCKVAFYLPITVDFYTTATITTTTMAKNVSRIFRNCSLDTTKIKREAGGEVKSGLLIKCSWIYATRYA